jgi:hypothetical protein
VKEPGGAQDLGANKFDIAFLQRTMTERNGRMAMRYAISTISNNPNIARTAMKVGESSATNNAGTNVTIARIFSPIQSSIIFSSTLVSLVDRRNGRCDFCQGYFGVIYQK